MADSTERVTRRLKTFYQEIVNGNMEGKQGIDKTLFPTIDADADSANFALDSLIKEIHGVSFRKAGEQSIVRPYSPGTGQVYEIPRSSEKTAITEKMLDDVIVGGEVTESLSSRSARQTMQILTDHTIGHAITKWKLALDTLRTGIFSPTGMKGESIGLEIDFGRDASLSTSYDFTESGATMDLALESIYNAYRAKNGYGDDLILIGGRKWIKQFSTDAGVKAKKVFNLENRQVESDLSPKTLRNTYGLKSHALYLADGCMDPMFICSFAPQGKFIQYKGATATDFIPDNEAILISLSSLRYKVLRGVDILNDSGARIRAVGDIVFDSFTEKDPVTTWLRSSTRFAFIPANINHTVRCSGTFGSDSE